MSYSELETRTRLIIEVKQAQILLNLLIGLKGIKYIKIVFLKWKVPKWSIEAHTRLIKEDKQAQI